MKNNKIFYLLIIFLLYYSNHLLGQVNFKHNFYEKNHKILRPIYINEDSLFISMDGLDGQYYIPNAFSSDTLISILD